MEAFQAIRVPIGGQGAHEQEAQRRAEIRAMIEDEFSDAHWRQMMERAHAAAEHGAHECLLVHVPAASCSDRGRAIIQREPGWPATLTGEAAGVYRRWHDELQRQGFSLEARVMDYPGGMPGDVGLFLSWRS